MSGKATWWVTPVVLLVLIAAFIVVLRDVFLTHRFMLTHDSVANFPPYQFAFTGVHDRMLPLWGSEMNAGEPIWPIAELHPAYEPLPLLIFAIATVFGATGITAFSFVLLAWLLGFALGGLLLARKLGLSSVSQIFVFAVLLWSSVGILMLYQSQYLVIARWVPLTLATGWWFLQRPGVSRAALFGVVFGLGMPGYQTPYLALFALVMACAGGRNTIALVRQVPRHVFGVAALVTLAILSPTLTAGAEWLGMAPVARAAWPRGTRAVLLPDVIAPLLGHVQSESALYVGIVPLILALVAGAVALWTGDGRARFWLWTTAGTLLIFLGAPEMITGRDRPFLFVRDWTFVLPLVVLGLAMLGGIGLDHVRSIFPARWSRPAAIALTALALVDLAIFASIHHRRVAFPRTAELEAREPATVRPVAGFAPFRRREFDIAAHAPFHKQGPTVWGIPSAFLDPEPFAPPYRPLVALGQIYTHGSHYLRLPRYDVVLTSVPRPTFDCIAGATCPIIRLVETGIAVPDLGTVLLTLTRLKIEHLESAIVVEASAEPGGAIPAAAGRPAGEDGPVGTFNLLAYRADRVEIDAHMRRPGFLYYADGYTPEWVASVNGATTPVLAANGAFKAVRLPEGTARVVLSYRPWRYIVAFAVRALGIVGGLLAFFLAHPAAMAGHRAPVESSRRPC